MVLFAQSVLKPVELGSAGNQAVGCDDTLDLEIDYSHLCHASVVLPSPNLRLYTLFPLVLLPATLPSCVFCIDMSSGFIIFSLHATSVY